MKNTFGEYAVTPSVRWVVGEFLVCEFMPSVSFLLVSLSRRQVGIGEFAVGEFFVGESSWPPNTMNIHTNIKINIHSIRNILVCICNTCMNTVIFSTLYLYMNTLQIHITNIYCYKRNKNGYFSTLYLYKYEYQIPNTTNRYYEYLLLQTNMNTIRLSLGNGRGFSINDVTTEVWGPSLVYPNLA